MKIYDELKSILKEKNGLLDENGEIKKWVIMEKARIYDNDLIKLLLKNERLKSEFFKKIDETTIFLQEKFCDFLELKSFMSDSFTSFKNKIGLTNGNKFIFKDSHVVLNFPYKDCVLEGGASHDDDKGKEIFFNEILARDEITQLFNPKVLTNFKRVQSINQSIKFNRDENINLSRGLPKDTITDNLLIKGNNLLALHSLKKEFAGRVKLIYIDPPYNTGNDSFKYNDSFNHSTWLVFMKNRLEIARELLKDDGVIFVQCDDNEQAYLKVLMDEIFGRENFISCVTCKVKSAGGLTTDTEMFFDCAEYLIVYSKFTEKLQYNTIKIQTETINSHSKTAKQYNSIINNIDFSKKEFVTKKDEISYYKIPKGSFNIETLPIKTMSEKDFFKKRNEIFRLTALSGGIGKKIKRHIENFTNNDDLFLFEYVPSKGRDKGKLSQYMLYKSQTVTMLNKLIHIDNNKQVIVKLEPISNIITDDLWQGISNEGQIKFKNAKKPESLIKRIIQISTQENDIVLDFFAGSGTTAAVAMKMNRQFIAIEQMDYIETITKERLKKVIEGEQGGISRALGWQGGGEFVYFELKKHNELFKEKILKAKNKREMLEIFKEIDKNAFLNYKVDMREFYEDINKFEALSLEEQKWRLNEFLDKNQLYVNLSSINDADFEISDDEKKASVSFYGEIK